MTVIKKENSPIFLKKLTMTYLTNFQRIFNDDELCQFLSCPYPLPREWVKRYIAESMEKFDKKEKFTWGVFNKRTDLFIGVGVIKNIDEKNRIAELGYCLEKASWNRGYTELTVRFLLEYAFTNLSLNRIEVRVDCDNKRTIEFMNRIGAENEGRLRQALYSKGNYYDIYLFSILYDDYLNWKIENKY